MALTKADRASAPLQRCSLALSGAFPGCSQAAVDEELIQALGARLSKTVNSDTTLLITSDSDFAKPSVKASLAKPYGIQIVKLAWLEDCLDHDMKLGTRKRNVAVFYADTEERGREEDEPQAKKKNKPVGASVSQPKDTRGSEITASPIPESKLKRPTAEGETNLAALSYIRISVDEVCPLTPYTVYVDRDRVIYDATLNQTNASNNNNNKFYRIQSANLGDGSLQDAMRQFESNFKVESSLECYTEDSGEEQEPKLNSKIEPGLKQGAAPESKLTTAVQDMIELIFNQQYFAVTMIDPNYDTNKLPLGKLTKSTIIKGYQD
ncbi:polymerase 2 ADP-ribosyltransferase 2 [Diplocarpon mali]|nr:polymerase 2 ADP-ribosyltransferase 2 [Diplocarpon mali]